MSFIQPKMRSDYLAVLVYLLFLDHVLLSFPFKLYANVRPAIPLMPHARAGIYLQAVICGLSACLTRLSTALINFMTSHGSTLLSLACSSSITYNSFPVPRAVLISEHHSACSQRKNSYLFIRLLTFPQTPPARSPCTFGPALLFAMLSEDKDEL